MQTNIVISPHQSRAARALLGMSSEELKEKTGLGVNTVLRYERGQTSLNMQTVGKLVSAYMSEGVEFPDAYTVRFVPREDRAA